MIEAPIVGFVFDVPWLAVCKQTRGFLSELPIGSIVVPFWDYLIGF